MSTHIDPEYEPEAAEFERRTRENASLREQNDTFRTQAATPLQLVTRGELVITRGVARLGDAFFHRAIEAVRAFDDFTPENDPWGEHDFGSFQLDAIKLCWKIDYYDEELEMGSPDPANPDATRRVLTIMLAEEY